MSALDDVRRSPWIVIATLFLFAVIAGCGSSSTTSTNQPQPSPTPGTPAPGPTPSPAPGGSGSSGPATFVYARTSGSEVSGFRLNADGTLIALAGSPFAVAGTQIAASGGHLFSSSSSQLLVFGIDPQSGALTAQSQVAVPQQGQSTGEVAAAGGTVYSTGTNDAGDFVVYAFNVGQNGQLTPVAGSPFPLSGACELCVMPESIAVDAKYLVVGEGGGEHSAGGFTVFTRQTDGSLTRMTSLGGNSTGQISLDATDRAVYAVDDSVGDLLVTPLATGQTAQSLYSPTGVFTGVAADRSGKFVVAALTPGSLVTYAVNSDGTLGQQPVSSVAIAGNSSNAGPVVDPSGRYVVLQEGNGLSVFRLDTSGTLTKVGTTATSGQPGQPVIVTP